MYHNTVPVLKPNLTFKTTKQHSLYRVCLCVCVCVCVCVQQHSDENAFKIYITDIEKKQRSIYVV